MVQSNNFCGFHISLPAIMTIDIFFFSYENMNI